MTREEAIKTWLPIISMGIDNMPELKEAFDMAIKALEQIPKLQNRCYVLTHGVICGFCPYECEHKSEAELQDSEIEE